MKTIIEMAREAGFAEKDAMYRVAFVANKNNLERFAELVRADEREACAKAVLKIANDDAGNPYKQALRIGAEAIRARGNT